MTLKVTILKVGPEGDMTWANLSGQPGLLLRKWIFRKVQESSGKPRLPELVQWNFACAPKVQAITKHYQNGREPLRLSELS